MGIQITVREVNQDTFREFKAEAIARGMTLGAALTLAMEKFKSDLKRKRPKFTELQPVSFGPGSEYISEQIDEILYGE